METVTDFIFLGSKITAHGDCSHEIKRRLLLGRKVMPSIRQMSGQRSQGSVGAYQADERAGVARLSWRVSGR